MITAAPGQVIEITADHVDSGKAGVLGYRLIDTPAGTEVVARSTDGVVEAPAGSALYAAELALPPTLPLGEYSIVWDDGTIFARDTLKVTSSGAAEDTPSHVGYPTTEELVGASHVDELTTLTSEEQDVLRSAAIASIEEFCGQVFSLSAAARTIDGQGANVLYLPQRLESFASVTVDGYLMSAVSVILSDDRDRLHMNTGYALNYYERALMEVSGESFPLGFGNVVIVGEWGWAEFPDGVRTAILWDMEDTARADANLLSASVSAFRKLGIRTINQGNLSADLMGLSGLSPRVQNVLLPFCWHGRMGALA